jgi:hypothetical protein
MKPSSLLQEDGARALGELLDGELHVAAGVLEDLKDLPSLEEALQLRNVAHSRNFREVLYCEVRPSNFLSTSLPVSSKSTRYTGGGPLCQRALGFALGGLRPQLLSAAPWVYFLFGKLVDWKLPEDLVFF